MPKKRISILGSTGSIGVQALQVISEFKDDFEIIGLSAGKNVSVLKQQIKKFNPRIVAVSGEKDAEHLENFIREQGFKIKVAFGEKSLVEVATRAENQLLLVAIVGTAALRPTYFAIEKGITIGLASKEVLVAAGSLIMALAKKKNVPILPVDSEHAALRQCLSAVEQDISLVEKVILTASGGPFWKMEKQDILTVTKAQALKHPNWEMGAKITVDSSTLMNKGLEIIEAHHLFNLPLDKISAVIHPQSITHALAEFTDGTFLAQMSMPDMRFPIQYALTYPKKDHNSWARLNLTAVQTLEFFEIDADKFPLFSLCLSAADKGGAAPAAVNAANEAAAALFLADKIRYNELFTVVRQVFEEFSSRKAVSLEELVALDKEIKLYTHKKYG